MGRYNLRLLWYIHPLLAKLGWWQINIRASEVIGQTAFRNNHIVGAF